MNTYEVMFLLDPAFASHEEKAHKEIDRLMERAGAEVIAKHRWDERRLAYEIKRRKRGVYFLVYMRAPSSSVRTLERDVRLSEGILRVLVLRAEHVEEEKMHNPIAPPSEYSRRGQDEWSRAQKRQEAKAAAAAAAKRSAATADKAVAVADRPKTKPEEAPAAEPQTHSAGPGDQAAAAPPEAEAGSEPADS